MSIINALPSKIAVATTNTNGLMSSTDKRRVDKIDRMEADIAMKMPKNAKITSSQLATSNDSDKIQLANLSTGVIDAMTGKTQVSAKIDFNSLITEHYTDESVTFAKRTPLGTNAIICSESYCNFDTTGIDNTVLEIPDNYTIIYAGKRKEVTNTAQTLRLEKHNAITNIVYSELGGIEVYTEPVHEQDYLLGIYDGTNVIMFNGRYTVNGAVAFNDNTLSGSTIKDFTLDSRKLAISHGIILENPLDGPFINVNFTSKFIEIIKPFTISIMDQKIIKISKNQFCNISVDKSIESKYLFIYYNLGSGKLHTIYADENVDSSILINDEKLILLGIIKGTQCAIGINKDFFSVDAKSTKINPINYIQLVNNSSIIVNYKKSVIEARNVQAFINNKLVNLSSENEVIRLSEDIKTSMVINNKPYVLCSTLKNFDQNERQLVLIDLENLSEAGLDLIPIAVIHKYHVSNNDKYINIINENNGAVKLSKGMINGMILPSDNITVALELTTSLIDGELHCKCVTKRSIKIVDTAMNAVHPITVDKVFNTIIDKPHSTYTVLFNTAEQRIEIVEYTTPINTFNYIHLGLLSELGDSLLYTAAGTITDHVLLNGIRPDNYVVIEGPDPDLQYDWTGNRVVIPDNLYMIKDATYSIQTQNISMNRFVDNDSILYEISLPDKVVESENTLLLNSSLDGEYKTRLVGKFKGNNVCSFKDINLNIINPKNITNKSVNILCIGDETVDYNMPGYIKKYLSNYDVTANMLGTTANFTDITGYGLTDLPSEKGEGHKGWRFTDIVGKTKRKNNSIFTKPDNKFLNTSKQFDFTNYMNTNHYDAVDFVIVSAGMNDITGYHVEETVENIEALSIYQNIEQLPNLYKEMISSIHQFNPEIKIIINLPILKGLDDDYNHKALMLSEALLYELKSIPNVTVMASYICQPLLSGANKQATEQYQTVSSINNMKTGNSITDFQLNGMVQSNMAFVICSTILNLNK